MQAVTTIGLDIAKSVFQVHGVDAEGNVIIRRQLKRRYVLAFFQKLPPCLVGIEACASSHHWSRELQALGHTVRLMPPAIFIAQRSVANDPKATSHVSAWCAPTQWESWRRSILMQRSARYSAGLSQTP
jgi:transposase